jgi:ion channel POLLUX/CASTOR
VVIKTALALTNNPHRSSAPFHIVGELHNPASVEAATLVGRTEAHWVLASELISRIAVQSSRQSGLSIVYSDLLDFAGDEVYFTAQPSLIGRTVGEAQLAFATSTVIGVVTASGVELNPSPSRLIADTEQLIVIAEDDDRIELAPPRRGDPSRMSDEAPVAAAAERTLILGLNHELPTVVRELAEYVVAGSTVTIVVEGEAPELPDFPTLTVTVENADATSRAVLERIAPGTFDHIIVLSYKDTLEVQQADAKTLITLLHLRDIERRDGLTLNIVSEMLDDRNRELAEVTRADDFIVSDRLVSLVLSQLSENHRLHEVFDELLTSGGSEIYLRPVAEYITPGEPVDFYTVTEAAQRKGETALGYRIAAQAATSAVSFGVALNPDKTESVAFTEGDTIIVLAAG